MSKIKLIQSVQILDNETSYSEVQKTVNELKTQIQNQLKEEGLENEFEVIVDVKNDRKSISLRPEYSDLGNSGKEKKITLPKVDPQKVKQLNEGVDTKKETRKEKK